MSSMKINADFNEVLSVISHEMKSPIALIKANLELLKVTNNGESKSFDMIFRELEHLEKMSQNLINTMKGGNDKEKVFLLDVIEDILDSYKNTHTNISFTIECDNEDISIVGSNEQLHILVNNLVKNAVEAIHQRGSEGDINIILTNDNNKIILDVVDNGIGLTKTQKENIYTKFYTTKKNGSGLGLSITKYILSQHNGRIDLNNNIYGGCTASVVFEQ